MKINQTANIHRRPSVIVKRGQIQKYNNDPKLNPRCYESAQNCERESNPIQQNLGSDLTTDKDCSSSTTKQENEQDACELSDHHVIYVLEQSSDENQQRQSVIRLHLGVMVQQNQEATMTVGPRQ